MYPLHHCLQRLRSPLQKIERRQGSTESQRNHIPHRSGKRHRSIWWMRESCAQEEERLNAEIYGEDFLLQGGKCGHGQGVIANFGHDEGLHRSQHEPASQLLELACLVELCAQQSAIQHDVVGCNVGEWAQNAEGEVDHGGSTNVQPITLVLSVPHSHLNEDLDGDLS